METTSNPLRAFAYCVLGWLCVALLTVALGGCSSVPPTLRSVATERGAKDTAAAACMLAHTFDGQWDELEVMRRFCSKREFIEPWIEEAFEIKRLVVAQRAGKPRPEPEAP